MGLLALAGAVSGMGQGLERGLSQMQTQIGADALAENANKRLVAREDTAYQRKRFDITEERAYSDVLRRKLFEEQEANKDTIGANDLKRREKGLEKKAELDEKEFDAGGGLRGKKREEDTDAEIKKKEKTTRADLALSEGTIEQRAGIASKESAAGAPLREAQRKEKTESEIKNTTELGGNQDYLKGKTAIADAGESSGQRAQAQAVTFKLQQDRELAQASDAVVAAVKSGDQAAIDQAQNVYLAKAGKLMEAQKIDQTTAAQGMRETGAEITRLSTIMKDMVPGDPNYEKTKRLLTEAEAMHGAFTARAAQLSGAKTGQPKQEVFQIKDPRDKGGPPPAGGMVARAKGEKTVGGPSANQQAEMGAATAGMDLPQVENTPPPATTPPPAGGPLQPSMVPGTANPGPMEALKGGATAAWEGAKDMAGKAGSAIAGAIMPYGGSKVAETSPEEQARMRAAVQGQPAGMVAAAKQEPGQPPVEEAEVRDDRLMAVLKQHEGFQGKPYQDTSGKSTIGYGRNLDAKPLTEKQAERLMADDIADARTEATRLKYYENLDPIRQDAVTMLVYNMGLKGVEGFKKFNAAMEQGNWQLAKQELLNSAWAKQVGAGRASTMADMILTGRYSF